LRAAARHVGYAAPCRGEAPDRCVSRPAFGTRRDLLFLCVFTPTYSMSPYSWGDGAYENLSWKSSPGKVGAGGSIPSLATVVSLAYKHRPNRLSSARSFRNSIISYSSPLLTVGGFHCLQRLD
jgi:hypothetical protein